jgi:hypothetical protein
MEFSYKRLQIFMVGLIVFFCQVVIHDIKEIYEEIICIVLFIPFKLYYNRALQVIGYNQFDSLVTMERRITFV